MDSSWIGTISSDLPSKPRHWSSLVSGPGHSQNVVAISVEGTDV